jgi:hypothetical protein
LGRDAALPPQLKRDAYGDTGNAENGITMLKQTDDMIGRYHIRG